MWHLGIPLLPSSFRFAVDFQSGSLRVARIHLQLAAWVNVYAEGRTVAIHRFGLASYKLTRLDDEVVYSLEMNLYYFVLGYLMLFDMSHSLSLSLYHL